MGQMPNVMICGKLNEALCPSILGLLSIFHTCIAPFALEETLELQHVTFVTYKQSTPLLVFLKLRPYFHQDFM